MSHAHGNAHGKNYNMCVNNIMDKTTPCT